MDDNVDGDCSDCALTRRSRPSNSMGATLERLANVGLSHGRTVSSELRASLVSAGLTSSSALPNVGLRGGFTSPPPDRAVGSIHDLQASGTEMGALRGLGAAFRLELAADRDRGMNLSANLLAPSSAFRTQGLGGSQTRTYGRRCTVISAAAGLAAAG